MTGFAVAALWGATSRAKELQQAKRIAVVTGLDADNPGIRHPIEKLRRALQARGWREGDSLQAICRFAAGDPERVQSLATELGRFQPDVIVAHTALVVAKLHQTTPTLPIVFVSIPDSVADGFVASLGRPGGNMTGFTNYDFSISGKWLEILTEIAPQTRRVGVLPNPDAKADYSSYAGYWRSVEAGARSVSVVAELAPARDPNEIESAVATLATTGRSTDRAAFCAGHGPYPPNHRRGRRSPLPAIYGLSAYARQGGLVAYGTDLPDLFGRAADYVDRILKGENPADLPVQGPTKFELVVNLKTANALGLTVPQSLLARADEIIE